MGDQHLEALVQNAIAEKGGEDGGVVLVETPQAPRGSLEERVHAALTKSSGLSLDTPVTFSTAPSINEKPIVMDEEVAPEFADSKVEAQPTKQAVEQPRDEDGKFAPKDTTAQPAQAATPSPSGKTIDLPKLGLTAVPIEDVPDIIAAHEQMVSERVAAAEAAAAARAAAAEEARAAAERSFASKQSQIEDALRLLEEDPMRFAEAYREAMASGSRPSAQPQTDSVPISQIDQIVEMRLARIQADQAAKAAEAAAEARWQGDFNKTFSEVYATIDPKGEYGKSLQKVVSSDIALAIVEGKVNQKAPPAYLKAQLMPIARKAYQDFVSERGGRVKAQEAVNRASPTPVVGGGTMMPKQDAPVRDGTRESLVNRILGTVQRKVQSQNAL